EGSGRAGPRLRSRAPDRRRARRRRPGLSDRAPGVAGRAVKVVRDANAGGEESAAGTRPLVRDLRSIGHHARQLQHNAATLATEVQSTSDDLERYLTERVRRQPYSTLGAAVGIGYVLGGGLRSSFTVMPL